MPRDRRDFLERMAAGAAFAAGLGAANPKPASAARRPAGDPWDLTWVDRIKGSHRAVFDSTEIEDGTGLLRALLWKGQYAETLGIPPAELTPVVVIRHVAIPLAMSQEYWDRYDVGKKHKVKNPFSDKSTSKNPVLLPKEELPPPMAGLTLPGLLEGGGIALACNLAFNEIISTVAKHEKLETAEARKKAITMIYPGVILQPSGVFATIRAQEAGCHYIKAS
ncbi:MAG: hypothetical protein ABI647_17650 [Gemmatimonadota bacterium]